MRSFTNLLEAEVLPLRRFAFHLTADPHSADDLVHDCVERAILKQHLWEPGTNLRGWLFRMMRNIHISGIRRNRTAYKYTESLRVEMTRTHPGNQLDNLELRDVSRSMNVLPPEQLDVVLLSALQGMSYQEISDTLSLPVGTVRSRLSRARSALRGQESNSAN